jgi:hypothetical protein
MLELIETCVPFEIEFHELKKFERTVEPSVAMQRTSAKTRVRGFFLFLVRSGSAKTLFR